MDKAVSHRQLTDRDTEILLALDRCPLTVRQLMKLSESFDSVAFTSPRSVQDRLHKLHAAGWVRSWRYATTGRGGSPEYYKLSLLGHRLLYGKEAVPPTKRYLAEIGIAHHHHTLSLSEFIVHTAVAAHRQGIRMVNFYRENTLRLVVGDEAIFPDCAFELASPAGLKFNFLVELDNGTERVRSQKDAESWQRKIRLYDGLQNESYPHRFRVLVVTTRSGDRLRHILDTAATGMHNPRRTLFYGVHLQDYLAEPDAACAPCLRDHRNLPVVLVPRVRKPVSARDFDRKFVASPPAIC
jgi:hypothetical protein